MSDVKCASCSVGLSGSELHDGWCESCGKPIPLFVYHQAGLKGPKQKALPRMAATAVAAVAVDPDDGLPRWQIALMTAAGILLAAVIVAAFL